MFRDNLIRHNEYGVHGQGRGTGSDSIQTFLPGARFEKNAIAGGDPARYPSGNTFLRPDGIEHEVVDAASGDFRLKPGSRLERAASDGRDIGADVGSLSRARAAVVTRPSSPAAGSSAAAARPVLPRHRERR